MKASIKSALVRLPGPATARYPQGAPFATVMSGGTMSVEDFVTWVVFYGPHGGE